MAASTPEIHTAQKSHRCSWCGSSIVAGEQYTRWRYYGDEGVCTVKMHPECEAAQTREVDQGGDNEWGLFDMERGKTSGETDAVAQPHNAKLRGATDDD